MITEQDLKAAIAECQGERNPDARTCMKLAAYYIILEHLEDKPKAIERAAHSFDAPNQAETVKYKSKTEFSELVNGREINEIMPHIDELVTAVRDIAPRLYDVFIRRLKT